ncbi:MAG: DedA family protein [Azovibrio sp.]|nr:DedA family protein [Azovibrio sp.]
MKIFSPLYRRALQWARHPRAPWYLGGMSFAESSFFPVPPDVMLAPMCLASPAKAWRFAGITTLTSVLGGLFGYAIGHFALDSILPWLQQTSHWATYQSAVAWFERWGVWAVFIAGFSPIPYKVFTLAAGALSMPLVPFILASCVGRGLRFFLVAGLMAWGGARMEAALHRYVDRLGWASVAVAVLAGLWYGLD